MKPGMILVCAGLAAALGLVVWQGSRQWREANAQRETMLRTPQKRAITPAATAVSAAVAEPVSAVKYADVADKNLFSKDRNPNVVIEQKPQEEKKMPALPAVYGVMGLPSGVQALMAEMKGAPGRPVRQGDSIGEFKVLALNTQTVKFEWNGKEVERKVDELIDRSSPAGNSGPAAAPAVQGPAAQPPPPPQQASAAAAGKHGPVQIGSPMEPAFNCLPNDNSPAGTVDDGFRKTILPSPFGSMCKWVAVR